MNETSTSAGTQAGFAISLLLLALLVTGVFAPGGMDWGISFAGYLPLWSMLLLVVVSLAALALLRWRDPLPAIRRLADFSEKHSSLSLSITLTLFVLAAVILHVRASILGDSYTLLQNFAEYQRGLSILAPWHEPLSIYTLYYATTTFSPLTFPQIAWSFAIVEVILGACYVVLIRATVRELFDDPVVRLIVFASLLVLPTTEFYFGYIEVYAVSSLLLAAYLFAAVRVLRGKLTYAVLPSLYVLATLSHYISGLLGVSLLYVTYRQWKERGPRPVLSGVAIGAALGVIVLAVAGFDLTRLIDESPISHILSLTSDTTPINAYSQAYTIFSFYHAVDIGNYLLFMAPGVTLVLLWWLFRRTLRINSGDTLHNALGLMIAPFLLFMPFAKLEQGFASDWDVFAGYFIFLNLWFGYYVLRRGRETGVRLLLIVTLISACCSLPWFVLNTTRDPNIRRFESLWDQRILSHLGRYTHTLRLSRFYESDGDSTQSVALWDRYIADYPDDPRGYDNRISELAAHAPQALDARDSTYRRWLAVDPGNAELRQSYAAFLVTTGNERLSHNDPDGAQKDYRNALSLDSTNARAWNNLGTLFAQRNDLGTATRYFEQAVKSDTTYSDGLYNLGNACIDGGQKEKGEKLIIRSAALGNAAAAEYCRVHGLAPLP